MWDWLDGGEVVICWIYCFWLSAFPFDFHCIPTSQRNANTAANDCRARKDIEN
jgi:hypothetical protein